MSITKNRILNAFALIFMSASIANYYLGLGLFGSWDRYVMLASFIFIFVVVYLSLDVHFGGGAQGASSETQDAKRSDEDLPIYFRPRFMRAFWVLAVSLPIIVWIILGSPGGWSGALWFEIFTAGSALVFSNRMKKIQARIREKARAELNP